MHWPENIRADFYEQLLSEIKIPGRLNPKRRAWKARTDRRNEALDCTIYALYLSRHLRLHLRRPAHWDLAELRLRQIPIIPEAQTEDEATPQAVDPSPAAPVQTPAPPAVPPPTSLAQAHLTQMLRARAAQRHGQRR
jgi:phage terminase large subunit GpA-like protein